jgi:hypothetical protein
MFLALVVLGIITLPLSFSIVALVRSGPDEAA